MIAIDIRFVLNQVPRCAQGHSQQTSRNPAKTGHMLTCSCHVRFPCLPPRTSTKHIAAACSSKLALSAAPRSFRKLSYARYVRYA